MELHGAARLSFLQLAEVSGSRIWSPTAAPLAAPPAAPLATLLVAPELNLSLHINLLQQFLHLVYFLFYILLVAAYYHCKISRHTQRQTDRDKISSMWDKKKAEEQNCDLVYYIAPALVQKLNFCYYRDSKVPKKGTVGHWCGSNVNGTQPQLPHFIVYFTTCSSSTTDFSDLIRKL